MNFRTILCIYFMYFILCYPVNCVLTNNNFNHFCIFVLVETSGSQEASQEARKCIAKTLTNTPAAKVMQTGFCFKKVSTSANFHAKRAATTAHRATTTKRCLVEEWSEGANFTLVNFTNK